MREGIIMDVNKSHSEQEIIDIYERNVDMVYRICFSYMKNIVDSEDAVSQTFIKYLNYHKPFLSLEHEKAWFIVAAKNTCKDMLKQWWYKKRIDKEVILTTDPFDKDKTREAVLELPNRYKMVTYLYYYEGYNNQEIAHILKIPSSTVRNRLARSRKILKRKLGENMI